MCELNDEEIAEEAVEQEEFYSALDTSAESEKSSKIVEGSLDSNEKCIAFAK